MHRLTTLLAGAVLWLTAGGSAFALNCPTVPSDCTSPSWNAPVFVTPGISDGAGHTAAPLLHFQTMPLMRAFKPRSGTTMLTAITAGRITSSDGGGATWDWNATSTAAIWDPFVLNSVGVSTGRWILRIPTGGLSVKVGGGTTTTGIACDGTTDDTAGFTTLFGNARQTGSLIHRFMAVIPPGAACYVATPHSVVIGHNQGLMGTGPSLDNSGLWSQEGLILGADTSGLQVGGYIGHLMVTLAGLTAPPTTMEQYFAATAAWRASGSVGLACGNDGCTFEDLNIVGFNTAILSNLHATQKFRHLRFEDENGLDISNSADTLSIEDLSFIGRWSAGAGAARGIFSMFVGGGSGGTGYTAGDVLTMKTSGSTCATFPTATVKSVVSGVITDPTFTGVISGNTLTVSGLTGTLAVGETISSATWDTATGKNVLMGTVITAGSGTTWTVSVSQTIASQSMVASGVAVSDTGHCAVMNPGANPVSFTGGTGTGATLTLQAAGVSYHSGTGVNFHNATPILVNSDVNDVSIEGYHIGVLVDNVGGINLSQVRAESGSSEGGSQLLVDATSVGLSVINGGSANVNNSAFNGKGADVNLSQTGGGAVSLSSVTASNVGALTTPILFGPSSSGSWQGFVFFNNGGASGQASFNQTGTWLISGGWTPTAGTPWYTIDAASAPLVKMDLPVRYQTLTSGASLTALCNDFISVSDTTAPTVTLPAMCPVGQDVVVVDVGSHASADNITVTAPGGTTLNGASAGSVVISTNGHGLRIRYNGTAAMSSGSP